jgi:acetyl esterase/lipase
MMAIWLVAVLQASPVREHADLAYYEGKDADPKKQRLNLFVPDRKDAFPLLMWIHGGGWKSGDRALFGELGRRFAEAGIGCAVISYRLSPEVQHPEHVRDCARAFAWLRAHAKEYGADPERLYVAGQSAGGHLAALLALHPKYLEEVGVPPEAIRGVIPMSGIYHIPALKRELPGMKMFKDAFGSDPDACRDASPTEFAVRARAPMLVITEADEGGGDEGVPASKMVRMSTRGFQAALEKAGFKDATFKDAAGRNHLSIVTRMMAKGDDPVRAWIVDFILKGPSSVK